MTRAPGRGEPWPAPGPLFWAGTLAALAATTLLRAAYFALDDVANGEEASLALRLMTEGTSAVAALLVIPLAVWTTRHQPPARVGWPRSVLAHLATFVAFSAAKTTLMAASRRALAPLLGFADYEYGALGVRLLMEAPSDAIGYATFVCVLALVHNVRMRRQRELEALALEREVARARLANLQLQLQPHFLFNALNTISAAMYDDPRAADEMMGHLSDLLRHALGAAEQREVPLRDELRLLDSYLALARARFGDRVAVLVEVDEGLDGALVPPLLLQPLVENAFRHGIGEAGTGRVDVRAARAGGELRLSVENDVAAHQGVPPAGRHGVGLDVTRRRLALLHGDLASMAAGPTPEGRWRVEIRLPRRAGTTGSAAPLEPQAHAHPAR